MGFLTSLFGGTSLGTKPRDNTLEGYIGGVYGFTPHGLGGQRANQIINKIDSGEDVSSLGALNTIRQAGAAERQGIESDYMTGANGLIANTGGSQAAVAQRMKEIAIDRQREREGRDLNEGVTNLRDQAVEQKFRAKALSNQLRLQAMLGAAGLQGNYYANRYYTKQSGGIIPGLGSLAAGAGGAAAGFRS